MKNLPKQLIHAWVDPEVYLMLKAQGINISATTNKLFSNYLDMEHSTPQDEQILIEEINSLKDQRKNVVEELAQKSVQLSMLQQRRVEEEKIQAQAQNDIDKTLKQGGVLNQF